MTEIDLNKVKLPARVRLRNGDEQAFVLAKRRDGARDNPYVCEMSSGALIACNADGTNSPNTRYRDIIEILEEGVTFPPTDAPVKAAPAVIDLTKEKLPVEGRQRDGEQVTVTKALDDGWFEVLFGGGKRRVRANGRWTATDREAPVTFDIVEIIRDAGPALPFGLRAEDGWLPWSGGECPVAAWTVVEYMLKHGNKYKSPAHRLGWGHLGGPGDIIAYRVIKEAPQPARKSGHVGFAVDVAGDPDPQVGVWPVVTGRAEYLEWLRDTFAAAAISGSADSMKSVDVIRAYAIADAVLAARAASKAGGEA